MPGKHSEWEPPDTISNSAVKRLSADDSVRSPHVKVGHCQALYFQPSRGNPWGFFISPLKVTMGQPLEGFYKISLEKGGSYSRVTLESFL